MYKNNPPLDVPLVTHAALSPEEISDLIDLYRLQTIFLDGSSFKHPENDSTGSPEQTWHNEEIIGLGGCGQVWMQRCGSGPELRAVKKVRKDMPVDWKRELYAMAVFQKVRSLTSVHLSRR